MRKRRERITKGFAAVDDRTVWTLELNRDELMIILNGIKNHRIKMARMKLAALREQRNRRLTRRTKFSSYSTIHNKLITSVSKFGDKSTK